MTWAKLDDQMPDHPKIVEAGPLASWLHICGICYCSRYLTDGFIPQGQVRRLADVEDPMGLAARLVAAGMWEEAEGGYRVHDYLNYNPSAEMVKRERAKTAERQAIFRGKNPGYNDRYTHRDNAVTDGVSNGESNAVTTGVGNAVSAPSPYPSRTRTPSEDIDNSKSSGNSNLVADAGASSDADVAPTGADALPQADEPMPDATHTEKPAKIAADAPAMRLAIQLREAVLAHNSTALDARKAMTGQGIQAWARKLDALISDPRRAPPDVEAVIAYAVNDVRFWRAIILNPDKLKKHFDMINGQRLTAQERQAGQATGGNGNGGYTAHGSGNGRRAGAHGTHAGKPAVGTDEYYAQYAQRPHVRNG